MAGPPLRRSRTLRVPRRVGLGVDRRPRHRGQPVEVLSRTRVRPILGLGQPAGTPARPATRTARGRGPSRGRRQRRASRASPTPWLSPSVSTTTTRFWVAARRTLGGDGCQCVEARRRRDEVDRAAAARSRARGRRSPGTLPRRRSGRDAGARDRSARRRRRGCPAARVAARSPPPSRAPGALSRRAPIARASSGRCR